MRHSNRHPPSGRFAPMEQEALQAPAAPTAPSDAMGMHSGASVPIMHNAHPHMEPSTMHAAGHTIHDPRDKAPEHHPPLGLV